MKKCEECGETKGAFNRKQWNKILCQTHMQQMKKYGHILKEKCGVCDICKRKDTMTRRMYEINKELCQKHYSQMQRHGKILDRTRNDANKITTDIDGITEIILCDKYGAEKGRAIIDESDMDIASKLKWGINGRGYVINGKSNVPLHRYILGYEGSLHVDHINRNKLDNRKENLRLVKPSDNSKNISKYKTNTSGYTGVTPNSNNEKWRVRINVDKKEIHLGTFKKIEDAVVARLEAEKKYHGEFASQRHLFEQFNIA